MKKLIIIAVLLLAIAGGATYWVASHHVVRTEDGTCVLPKRFLAWADSFVDVRPWSSSDFEKHPELRDALKEGGFGDLLSDLKKREWKASAVHTKDKSVNWIKDTAKHVAQETKEVSHKVSDKVKETFSNDEPEMSEK